MNKRIEALTVVLLVSFAWVSWLRWRTDATVNAIDVDLSVISRKIDTWTGEDTNVADDTVRVLNAQSFISRLYREPTGREISLHVANWTNTETISSAPHHPEICYPAAGWTILERRTAQFPTSAGDFPIELILFQKGQQRVVVGVWFQVGDIRFVSADGFQRQRYRFWGTKGWPNTTKFLIQTRSASLEAAEDSLKKFATLVANEFSNQRI